jgi:hypothetical protein
MNDYATHDEVYFTTSCYATKSMDRDEAAITLMTTATGLVIMQREVVDSDFMVDQLYFL